MSGIDSAAEVAEDYQHALEDLTMNSRIEIGNLTSVAKDSLQHAHAIAEVLQNHIKKAPPNRTLPALYVLDSIVKNVGTPYTLYFGKNLFNIFMGAYTKVDNMTRRKMDEMLKTWKEPVPGSMTKLPVFPPETTRPIENALIGARNAALAANQSSFQTQQQLLNRGRQPPIQRDTPTPPNVRPGTYGQPPSGPDGMHGDPNGAQHAYPMHPNASIQYPRRSTPQPAPPLAGASPHYPQPPAYGPPAGASVDNVKQDLQQLIAMARVESAQGAHDIRIQTKLKALLDLQTFLQSQNLSQDQLMLVKTKVAELTNTVIAGVPHTTQPLQPQGAVGPAMPAIPPQAQQGPVLPVAVAHPPPASSTPPTAAGTPLSLDSLFGQGALASLLAGARKSATPQASSLYPAPPTATAIRSPPPQRPLEPSKSETPVPSDPMALMAALRQSGLLPPASAPPSLPATAPAPPSTTPVNAVPLSLASMPGLAALLSNQRGGAVRAPLASVLSNAGLRPASLKMWNRNFIAQLYESLGPPCTQCGRRFTVDEKGRAQKTAHMDWHFRVNQRIAEAEKKGQHRSFYVDEEDWIRSREVVDTDYVAIQPDKSITGGTAAKASKLQYIAVPDDPRVNTMCPICQEKFEMKWLDEAQEWVWMDTVKVGDRVYHASCHREAARDGGGARSTPEPVLGKRKAENDFRPYRPKVKMEGY